MDVYTVNYKLSYADGTPFNKCHQLYTADVAAKTADCACNEVKSAFSMLDCKIVGNPAHRMMSEEDYNN